MTLSTYLETIASNLSTSVTFREGTEWEINLDLDNVQTFPVLYFLNYLTGTYTRDRAGRILYADYPVTLDFMQKMDEYDEPSSDLDTEVFEQMATLAQEFLKRVYNSSEYQDVAAQVASQTYNITAFRDRHDVIVAGVQLNLTLRLHLGEDSCI